MTGVRFLTLGEAVASTQWAQLCGPVDLFCTPEWLAVEQSRCGPWVPRTHGCLAYVEDDRILAGVTLQQFDATVDDETVRLDKMFTEDSGVGLLSGPQLAQALQPSLMCGGWFNSKVLTLPGIWPGAVTARRDLVSAAVATAHGWNSAAVFFPYVDAADTALRSVLRDAGFLEFPAPARHVFECDHPSYDDYLASLRSRRRTRLRKELRAAEESGLSTGHTALDHSTVERVAWLAHRLERKYGQVSTQEQLTEWFSEIARHTEGIVFTAAHGDGPVVGMSMWIRQQDRLYGFHAGFDYEQSGGLPLYSLVGYHLPMQYGCSRSDVAALEYGISADEAKLLRGTSALPQVLCVRPQSPRARAVLGRPPVPPHPRPAGA